MKTVILVNVGTPDSPDPTDVGRYLTEFLMDKYIIPLPRPFRDVLVKLIIVPKRKYTSSEKYKKIWTPEGSPLMVNSKALQTKLQNNLGSGWNVVLGMQVGNPRLKEAFQNEEIYFCPLYPQFAQATTGGALEKVKDSAKILRPFYGAEWFIKAIAEKIQRSIRPQDHLLLSYHGLPASQQTPYREQCLQTTELIKKEIGFKNISTGFQSRLGRGKWIEPYTEIVVRDLLNRGIKHLKVACPSFVADCLETLEEIGIELKNDFLSNGGESFELIPCVNDSDLFVKGLADHIRAL